MVLEEGFEPSRPAGHEILSLARFPVTPLQHMAPQVGLEPTTNALTVRDSTD